MKPIRAVFTFEAVLTLFSGLQGLLAPASLATQFVAEAPPAPALDFVRWLGAVWVVLAILQLGLLRRGGREAWSIALPAILVGDALHVIGQGVMLANGGTWGVGAAASIVLTVVYATCRLLALQRLERVL